MVGVLGEVLRKWGFALGGMLSGSWSNSVVGYLNDAYLEENRNSSRLKL